MPPTAESASDLEPVLVRVHGHAGRIRLNRPAAINALTLEMVRRMRQALDELEVDHRVRHVVIDGAGDRGLCAGGDIRTFYDAALVHDPAPRTFWAEEYRLNARIAHYPKPIVAIMDGIVMGGGVGISAHASHRVVTDRSVVAMPEVGIGFAPDVGGTWLLSRAPGEVGTHVALAAARLGAADAIHCGLADHHVPAAAIGDLSALLEVETADVAIRRMRCEPTPGTLEGARAWIDACYAADSVIEIVRRLRGVEEGASAAAEIDGKSPTSLIVTLRALREARALPSLERCLEMEHRISSTFLEVPDFVEGVRAAIVDKDRAPRWAPATLDEVREVDVERFFQARADDLRLGPSPERVERHL